MESNRRYELSTQLTRVYGALRSVFALAQTFTGRNVITAIIAGRSNLFLKLETGIALFLPKERGRGCSKETVFGQVDLE